MNNEELVLMSQSELENYFRPLTGAVQKKKVLVIAKHKIAALKEIDMLDLPRKGKRYD